MQRIFEEHVEKNKDELCRILSLNLWVEYAHNFSSENQCGKEFVLIYMILNIIR